MAVVPIFPVVLIVIFAKCNGQSNPGYNYINSQPQFGELLKPPPPPLLNAPVPFHGGKPQRQNHDTGYHYQTVSTPSVVPIPSPSNFKFPAPFYKQYNFNFVPSPQPFTTTPSPTIFQKISGWLFPSAQTALEVQNVKIEPFKKDCNPCNLVPWIPVIKYNLGDKNVDQNQNPTYGPPSPTALAQNVHTSYIPQQSNSNRNQESKQITYGPPHAPFESLRQFYQGASFGNPSSTYAPASATQQVILTSHNPQSSSHSSSNGLFDSSRTQLSTSYGLPVSTHVLHTLTTSTHRPAYVTPVTTLGINDATSTSSYILNNSPEILQNNLPIKTQSDNFNFVTPTENLQLPKVAPPTGFKNSYGEDITNSHSLDIPFSFTSLSAESSKIKTEVEPLNIVKSYESNISVALANPAPFTLNKGRNIHTLQPVALPNLSVSPLPPIFNARPFRPTSNGNGLIYGINYMKKATQNVNLEKSIPIAEFVHSVEYPTTIIQSPVIDIDATKTSNQNKAYRNILNSYGTDDPHDISPQASEDHISATKISQDVSFETTGTDFGNNLYDLNLPTDMRHNVYVPSNHKPEFADLRGIKDEDVDRYRTESNLQSIDSPLLYLKPSAPHKSYKNFILVSSTPESQKEYEIYDEISTTPASIQFTTNSLDQSRNYNNDLSAQLRGQENRPKIVQIIVPYFKEQKQNSKNKELHQSVSHEEHQGRKVPYNTEIAYFGNHTETSTVPSTTTEYPSTVTEHYDSELINTPAGLSDLNDVKEPPFDIIKLQHTIDDWTEQEYSNHYSTPDRTRSNEKYAKQIPDEYLTTINPSIQQTTEINDYIYDDFDHEGSSSVQYSVRETKNSSLSKSIKEYNIIQRSKSKNLIEKGQESLNESQKLRIYTAASSFRSTTTTPAPWGSIQTSISPLTKEKVYVVTSKPWRDKTETTTVSDYVLHTFESKKVDSSNAAEIPADDFLFSSPRFSSRPPFGFTSSGPVSLDSIKSDSSYGFSKGWHQSINNLRSLYQSDSTLLSDGSDERVI